MAQEIKRFSLRAHHLLCVQGFCGHGYNPEFVENLAKIVADIKKSPSQVQLSVTDQVDSTCQSCRHNSDDACQQFPDAETAMKKLDHAVLAAMGWHSGLVDSAKNLFEHVNEVFQTTADAEPVCGGCEWQGVCLWYEKLRRLETISR